MEGRRVEIVAEIAGGELEQRPACHCVKARHYRLAHASPQLRALTDSLILRRVRNDHITVCQVWARQPSGKRVVSDAWQRLDSDIKNLAVLDEDVTVMDVQDSSLELAKFRARESVVLHESEYF